MYQSICPLSVNISNFQGFCHKQHTCRTELIYRLILFKHCQWRMEIYLNHDNILLSQWPDMVGRHKIVETSLVTIMSKTIIIRLIFLTTTVNPGHWYIRKGVSSNSKCIEGGGVFAFLINIPPLLLWLLGFVNIWEAMGSFVDIFNTGPPQKSQFCQFSLQHDESAVNNNWATGCRLKSSFVTEIFLKCSTASQTHECHL